MLAFVRRHFTAPIILLGLGFAIAGGSWLYLFDSLPMIGMPPPDAAPALKMASLVSATFGETTVAYISSAVLLFGLVLIAVGSLLAISAAIERWA
jgi:hypothetical protein